MIRLSEHAPLSDRLKEIGWTAEHTEQARDWIKECQWRDIESDEDVDDLSDYQVWSGIARHYAGGLRQFLTDSTPVSKRHQVI